MRSFRSLFRFVFLVTVLPCLSFLALPANAQYTVTDLGTLGGTISRAARINALGHVAGSSNDAAGKERAFLWQNGVMTDLGSLDGYGQSIGNALNIHDDVAGTIYGTPYPTSLFHGSLFQNGILTDIGSFIAPPSNFSQSQALGINDSGQVVGYSEISVNGTIGSHAILWDAVHGLQDLTPGDHGSASIQAKDINNAGQIIGTLGGHAFLYVNGVLTDLTTATGVTFNANRINNLGQIAGGQSTTIITNITTTIIYGHAVLWQNSQAQVLGTLPGFGGSYLQGINNIGQSVGDVFNLNNSSVITAQDAILCVQGQLLDLNTVIPVGSGWHLDNASDINDSGQIVGEGTVNGQKHAFLLTPAALTLGVSPGSVLGGQSAIGFIVLASPAPVGGTVVALSTSNGVGPVPATVTIAEGSSTATFAIATLPVFTDTTVVLSAISNGATSTTNLTVQAPTAISLTLSPSAVSGGLGSTGTVTLSGPAAQGGVVVPLTSADTSIAAVPASVTVPAGATKATFAITTAPRANTATVVLTAIQGTTVTATLTISATQITGISILPYELHGGLSATGTVTIGVAAPAGGMVIGLSSTNPALVSVVASVTIAAGATTATFPVTTTPVSANMTVIVSASLGNNSSGTSVRLTPPDLTGLTVWPSRAKGGITSVCTVTISDPAPTTGIVVTLSSDNAAAAVPTTVTVPSGTKTATFTVNTTTVFVDTAVTITGTLNSKTKTGTLTVLARLPFDFDNDGHNDLVLQHQTSNRIVIWYTSVLNIVGGNAVSYLPPAGWQVVGCADINQDDSPDLFLQNQTTGKINVWYMFGTTIIGSEELSFQPGTGYKVVGIGDFNDDGKPDILFQQQGTGQLVIWYLNGIAVMGGVSVPQVPAAGYSVVGVADFNSDGKPDIVFQNQTTNQIVVWYLDGNQFVGGGAISYVPPVGWKVHAVEDINGDGKADLVFQNQSTNQLLAWFMNGLTIPGGGTMSVTPDPGYLLRGPR